MAFSFENQGQVLCAETSGSNGQVTCSSTNDLDDGEIYLLSAVKTQVDWDQETGYDSWNFYKGDLDVLRASDVYTQAPGSNDLAARQCGLGSTTAADVAPPDPGKTAFFLVTGVSGLVEGDLGQDSSGTPRLNSNPCP